jgi:arginine/lysine/ornithine decarboxylase
MLYLVSLYAKSQGQKPYVLAGRNAHKTFVGAAALLDVEIEWLFPKSGSYLSCKITGEGVEEHLKSSERLPTAVYITSPDYLGNIADVRGISEICHRYGVLLIVDNAHGAYLKFLPGSLHPMDLGADMCSDSAHKTLPVLTGGAYLHVSKNAPSFLCENAKNALSLFGSTSPSYLILSSLDSANRYLDGGYREKLARFVEELDGLKKELEAHGYVLSGDEPMKLTICTKHYGYLGGELAEYLSTRNFIPEFYDPDFLVLMLTPEISKDELEALKRALIECPKRDKIMIEPPSISIPKQRMSPREAIMSAPKTVLVEEAIGQALASVTVGCPPAVPILVSGEVVDCEAIKCFKYYGIEKCSVVK